MDNQFEKSISFKKHTGKETGVKIISETSINKGEFGEIFDTVIEIGGKRKRFIVKKYFDVEISEVDPSSDRPYAEKNAQLAFRNYSLAKEAGLKVFPTFRTGGDKKSILMTTGFTNNEICLGSNNALSVIDFKQPFIKEIEDIDKFLSTFFDEGLKAAKKGIILSQDCFFFILNKTEPVKIDFIIGDLDNLIGTKSGKNIELNNIKDIETTLIEFCEKNISPILARKFLDKVRYYYKQAFDVTRKETLK